MHELAITKSILDLALEKAREVSAGRVTSIHVVVGELSGAVSESVQFYFEFLSKDTPAEKATVTFTSVPARLRCRECNTDFHPEDIPWLCPNCGSLSMEVVAGRDLFLDSIEVT